MRRTIGAVMAVAVAVAWTSEVATAEPAPIDQAAYQALITGNSIEGVWNGRPYRQYFDASGGTIYQEQGQSVSFGRWRINAEGRMCTKWPPGDREVCYISLHEDQEIIWKSGDDWYPSTVVDGKVLY